ncbi:MAG: flavodoxin [Firmicutes bacterium]|nr:flavodoxin [Bacillota bacterium]
MNCAVVYSSKTGNTKKVAEAIYQILPAGSGLFSVEQAPEPAEFDILFLGFWVNRGLPDDKMKEYMEKVENMEVGLFATLGAYPDSEHARKSMEKAEGLLGAGCQVLATFICQGKIDPSLTKKFERLPADHPHAMTVERRERHEIAKSHPDQQDLAKAREIFREIIDDKLAGRRSLRLSKSPHEEGEIYET